jgi:hypothetical protein
MSIAHINVSTLVFASVLGLAAAGCQGNTSTTKTDSSDKPSDTTKATTSSSGAAAQPDKASTGKPAPKADGPSASEDKEFLGLDLPAMGAWKPVWDPDAKVAKWSNEESMVAIVNRIVTDKLDSVDDLKEAAPMMMQLGTAITKVDEDKKTDKGWYAVVERGEKSVDLVYVRHFGASTVVCAASIAPQDLGKALTKDEVIKACESMTLKK